MEEIPVYDSEWSIVLKGGHYSLEEVQKEYPEETVTHVDHIWIRYHRLSNDDLDDMGIDPEKGSKYGGTFLNQKTKPRGVVAQCTGVVFE